MQIDYVKGAVMAAWVLAVVSVGVASGTTSFTAWTVVAVMSLVPPAVVGRLWRAPSPSMSEAIRAVIR